MKLQIICIVEDDKVIPLSVLCVHFAVVNTLVFLILQIGTDFLEEEITAFEEYVQSVDVVAFNKL